MSKSPKNWYENYPYLQKIYEFSNDGLVPFPKTWNELEKWFNKIDNDISISELKVLINRIPKDDMICKTNVRELLAKRKILLKKDFDKIWKRIITKEKGFDYIQKIKEKKRDIEQSEISAVVKESEDTIYEVVCTERQIVYRRSRTIYNQKTKRVETKVFDTIIINEPFSLENIYYNQDSELYYEVQIGEEIICLNKKDTLDFIENERNYGVVSGRLLKECISVILRTSEKVKDLKPKEMYYTLGVFLDKDNNLVVVHPENSEIKLYGINDYQKRTIERCKKKGLDLNGDSLKNYFDLFNIESFPNDVKLVEFGHVLISAFSYVLREDIDIFPHHFYIVPIASVGKTELEKLVYCNLFGIELKTSDDMNSTARATENCTDTTFCLPIDDIDKLNQDVESYIKVSATTLKAQERMTRDRKTKFQETYRNFSGTANSDDFLSGDKNEALRDRCLISRDFKDASFEDLKKFEKIKEKILNGKILGFYILNKAIEYINNTINNDKISTHEKLKQIITQNKELLRDYLKENQNIIKNPRRLMIYNLLIISWQIWNYIFQEAKLICNPVKNILDYQKNNLLLDFIQTYEENTIQISYKEILLILEFYENVKEDTKTIIYENTNSIKVLTTSFITKYDEWARKRGYEILGSLSNLGDILSKFLKKNIRPKTIRTREIGSDKEAPCNEPAWGFAFYKNDIYKKLRLTERKQIKIASDNKNEKFNESKRNENIDYSNSERLFKN